MIKRKKELRGEGIKIDTKSVCLLNIYLLNSIRQPRHCTFQFSHSIQITTADLYTNVNKPE